MKNKEGVEFADEVGKRFWWLFITVIYTGNTDRYICVYAVYLFYINKAFEMIRCKIDDFLAGVH